MSDLMDSQPDGPSVGAEECAPVPTWKPSELENLARNFLAQGDHTAFEQLFALAWGPVKGFLRKQGIPEKDLDDSTQNVLFLVYEQIGTCRFEAPFERWLFTVAVNEWKNHWRYWKTKKRNAEERSIDRPATSEGEHPIDLATLENDPLMTTLIREQRALLVEAIGQLPPRMSQCLELRLLRELKVREIAKVLGRTEATVKSHLQAGLRRLRPLLQEHAEVFET